MNRSQHILKLALTNSGITDDDNDDNVNAKPLSHPIELESQGTELNSEIGMAQYTILNNVDLNNRPLIECGEQNTSILNDVILPDMHILQCGNNLLEFKQNLLRGHQNNVRLPICSNSEGTHEPEPFSPDASEYVPSIYKDRISNNMEWDSLSDEKLEDNFQPSTSKRAIDKEINNHNLSDEKLEENFQPSTSKRAIDKEINKNVQKRKMPQKLNPGRKRKRDPTNWKNNVNKMKKNLGQEFINHRGKRIKKKAIKVSCDEKCRKKCFENLITEEREKIFNDFWALGDHRNQMNFVNKCVERVPRKQVFLATLESSRRHWTYQYFFFIGDDKKIQICKKMFLNTLDITDKWVTTIFKKIDINVSSCVVLDDRRGRHNNRPNEVPEEVKTTVRTHISQIPLVDSHYVRARSSKKYLEATLTFPKLYKLYKEWLSENNYEPTVSATERQYREIFYNEYNIDFFKPKKDLCPTCDIYNRASSEEKKSLALTYTEHQASKFVARELKSQHKQTAQQNNSVVLATYDLQKILTTPASEVSVFYYKRKLAVYNLTIFDVGKNDGYCYVWDETIGKKGSNEISSAVYLFIAMKAKEGCKDFFFYSDNCGGQNRNRIVFAMYSYAAEQFNINISHIFYEVGHTQNEGDSMHALIERRKKHQVVYVPEQWVTIIRCAKTSGKPYTVIELNQSKILNFKDLMNKQTNFEQGTDENKIKWNKVRHLKIKGCNPKLIQLNYDFLSEHSFYIDLAQKKKPTRKSRKAKTKAEISDSIIIAPAYSGPIPISTAKFKDLNSLCTSQAIPELYRNYYKNLKHGVQDQSDSD